MIQSCKFAMLVTSNNQEITMRELTDKEVTQVSGAGLQGSLFYSRNFSDSWTIASSGLHPEAEKYIW